MSFHYYYHFFSLSAFGFGLTLLLKFRIMSNKLVCFLSASLIAISPLKKLSPKDLIIWNLLKSYTFLLYLYIKLFLLICSSNFLISFISFLITLLSESFVRIPSIDSGICWCSTGFKTSKASHCFCLNLQLFSFVSQELFLKEKK